MSKDSNPNSAANDAVESTTEATPSSPLDMEVSAEKVRDALRAKQELDQATDRILRGTTHGTAKPNKNRPRQWTSKASSPIVEIVSIEGIIDTGEVYLDYAQVPITAGSPVYVQDITQYVVQAEWSKGVDAPYETIQLTLRNLDSDTIKFVRGGAYNEFIYCRIRVPSDSPIDPNRVLAAGYLVNSTETLSTDTNGKLERIEQLNFVGWMDLMGRADCFGDMGLRLGAKRGTAIAWREIDSIFLKAEQRSDKSGKMGDALEVVWSGVGATASRVVTDRSGVTKTSVENLDGIARVMWPKALYDASITRDTSFRTFKSLSGLVNVVHNQRLMGGHLSQGLRNSGYSVPFVPGVATNALASHKTGQTVLSFILGTFVCDRQMVEAFPAILYDGRNVPALIYRMKPFRLTNAGSWIQWGSKAQEYFKRSGAPGGAGVFVDTVGDAGVSSKQRFLSTRSRVSGWMKGVRRTYDKLMAQSFGGDVWQLARSYAAVVHREMTFSHTITYSDDQQVNCVTGGVYNSPDTHNMYGVYAGVPIMDRARAYLEGVRLFSSSWPAAQGVKTNSPQAQFVSDSMQIRAIAMEAAQTILNRGTMGSGSTQTTFNPDILPGRCVMFSGFVGVEQPADDRDDRKSSWDFSRFTYHGKNPTDAQIKKMQDEALSDYQSTAKEIRYALHKSGGVYNTKKLDDEIEYGGAKITRKQAFIALKDLQKQTEQWSRPENVRRMYNAKWSQTHGSGQPSGNSFTYSNSYGYCERVSHTMTANQDGQVIIRTNFQFSRFVGDEKQRMNVKKISLPANLRSRAQKLGIDT